MCHVETKGNWQPLKTLHHGNPWQLICLFRAAVNRVLSEARKIMMVMILYQRNISIRHRSGRSLCSRQRLRLRALYQLCMVSTGSEAAGDSSVHWCPSSVQIKAIEPPVTPHPIPLPQPPSWHYHVAGFSKCTVERLAQWLKASPPTQTSSLITTLTLQALSLLICLNIFSDICEMRHRPFKQHFEGS